MTDNAAAELERLVRLRGRVQTEADCPWCGTTAAVVYWRGGEAAPHGALDDHQRPDGQQCRGTYEALARVAWLHAPSEETRAAYLAAAQSCGAASVKRGLSRLAAETALELERASGIASLEASLRELQVTVAKIRGSE